MLTMITYIASFLILSGVFFALIAALGIVRMPDIYCRIHAATKAGALGVGLILLALCLCSPTPRVWIQSALILLFFYLTAPIAAHMIGRVALLRKLPQWSPESDSKKRPN
jgi:multicomponent Na+:H+ antiporter subunit G